MHVIMIDIACLAGSNLQIALARMGAAHFWLSRPCWPMNICVVRPHDLRRLNAAFFVVNGYISLLLSAFLGRGGGFRASVTQAE